MHRTETGTYTDMHITRLCQKKWGTVGKTVRGANVGFSSLSLKFVCDDLIKDMKEEGKIPIMKYIFSS